MQNNTRYKIDVLLTLARITTDESKKANYIERIEDLLTEIEDCGCEDPTGAALSVYSQIDGFLREKDPSAIIGRTVKDVYAEYCDYCEDHGCIVAHIKGFGRAMGKAGYVNAARKTETGMAKVYISKVNVNNALNEI